MNIRSTLFAAAALMVAPGAWAACDYPQRIDIPNGASATQEEMVAGQKAVKQYMADMNAYLDCLESETKSAKAEGEAPEITAERESIAAKRHNAAVDEMETVAESFNQAVRAYKARQD